MGSAQADEGHHGDSEVARVLDVGVIGPSYPDSFADNIVAGLEDLGHRAVGLGPARPRLPGGYRAAAIVADLAFRSTVIDHRVQRRSILHQLPSGPLDVVIVVDGALAPSVVSEVKKRVGRIVFWYPDAVSNLGRQTMIQGDYDAVFTKEPALAEPSSNLLGLPFHLMHEACNPRWHHPLDVGEPQPHIVVMGNYYPYRVRLLQRLHRAGVPLRLYGNPFPRWLPAPELEHLHTGRYVGGEDKARVFRSAAAVLNAVHPAEIHGLNCRLFEAAGSGGTVLTEPRRELRGCFNEDEVVTFATFDELVDRARWCLDHPGESRAIGDRAAARAHGEHTYAHRIGQMLRQLAEDEVTR